MHTERPVQRTVRRGRASHLWPRVFLFLVVADLAWEVVKHNLPAHRSTAWPWRFTVLDSGTCATLVTATLGVLLARAQLSRTTRPVLSYSSAAEKSAFLRRARRIIHVHNAGGGHAIIRRVRYRYRTPGDGTRNGWLDFDTLVGGLERLGLEWGRDYWMPYLGNGAAIPQTVVAAEGLELLALSRRALLTLTGFEVEIRVEDLLGDVHERVLVCLADEHSVQVERQRRRFR